jgi:hypothetical protein
LPGDPRSPNVSSSEISSSRTSSSSMLDILQYSLMEGSTLIFGSRCFDLFGSMAERVLMFVFVCVHPTEGIHPSCNFTTRSRRNELIRVLKAKCQRR